MRNARQPFLPDRMMQRADADGLPDDRPLRALAVAVTDALAAPMLDDEGAAKNILKFGLDTLTPDLKRAQESRKPTARRGKDVDGAKMTTLTDSHRSARLT